MNIYVTHSSNFDYQKELYKPLRTSKINTIHHLTLPHERSSTPFNSKEYMKKCDLILAEVSYSATEQGIELGWANIYNIPIVCFYKKGMKLSSSLKVISNTFIEYKNSTDTIEKLSNFLLSFQNR
jgi:hypothetical protein